MSTFALVPGAGSGPDHWHLVIPLLRAAGHETVTPELPCQSDTAGLSEYTAAALDAIGDRDDLIVVGQSLGAFTAAAVAAARPTRLLVYVNAMIPRRGESPGAWWDAVGHDAAAAETLRRHGPMSTWTTADLDAVFLHDVPAAAAAGAIPLRQGGGVFATPLTCWPDGVPVRVISGRDDRLFPLAFQERLARERLGVETDVLPAGHAIALARPDALAQQLLAYLSEISSDPPGVTVRRALASDAPAIGAVFDAAVRDGWRFLGALADEPMFSDDAWDALVADHAPPNLLLVAADEGGQVVGYCAVHPEDGELHLLFVDPRCAGRGVGRNLLAAGHDALRATGCAEAFLYVHEQNTRARAVYAAAGYHPDGNVRESEFRGTHLRELRLVASLDASRRGHCVFPSDSCVKARMA